MGVIEVEKALGLVPELLEMPHTRIWTTYDKEADVLYINFKKPSHADDSELTDDDVAIRRGAVGNHRGVSYPSDQRAPQLGSPLEQNLGLSEKAKRSSHQSIL